MTDADDSGVDAVDLSHRQVSDAKAERLLSVGLHIETLAVPIDSTFCQRIASGLALEMSVHYFTDHYYRPSVRMNNSHWILDVVSDDGTLRAF